MEPLFDSLEGVVQVQVGYTGGTVPNPTYEEVCSGTTGHYEAVEIIYDPEKISYETLLKHFFSAIDPTDPEGQFVDRGPQYRSAIFWTNDEQREIAFSYMEMLEQSNRYSRPIATKLLPFEVFYPAEEYHQKFYRKNPLRYNFYKRHSGRPTEGKKIE
jgi:methionine-S-sulfoxide reductase